MLLAIGAAVVLFIVATALGWTTELGHHDGHDGHEEHAVHTPAYFAVLPFVALLGAIAVLPLIKFTAHGWERNTVKFTVAVLLAAATLAYYFWQYQFGLGESGTGKVLTVLEHALLLEFVPFIVLLFSLYTISGGIRIEGDLAAHPRRIRRSWRSAACSPVSSAPPGRRCC